MQTRTLSRSARLLVIVLAFTCSVSLARQGAPPYSLGHPAKVGLNVTIIDVPDIDAQRQRKNADAIANAPGQHAKRLAVAVGNDVSITPERDGRWDTLADGSRLWRVRVRAEGATDLRLGFDHFDLPRGATLYVIGADDYYQGPYSAADATGSFFQSSVVPGDTATVELRIPPGTTLASGALTLAHIGAGFRDLFSRTQTGLGSSGACNVNVVCPLGEDYMDDIRAVAYYEFRAADNDTFYICSGTLLADVPHDRKNYFLTAAHCISAASEAASMVLYWNYQSTQCGFLEEPPGGYLNDDQHGALLRATRADVDFTLVELAQAPDPQWSLYYAGWDATGVAPAGTIGIHHPSGDVKKITSGPAPTTTYNCISDLQAPGTHWQTGPYTQGTTEGGSSGSGLFIVSGSSPGQRRLIGTLSGGDAACSSVSPSQPNDQGDCYGKFSVAWNGPSASSRLRDWLDPGNSGATSVAGIDQVAATAFVRGHSTHAIPALRQRLHAQP